LISAAGFNGNTALTAFSIFSPGMEEVPKVFTYSDTGSATPME